MKVPNTRLSRGEKRWAGAKADEHISSARGEMKLGTLAMLALPAQIHWGFHKDVTDSSHYLYQAYYKSGGVTMRFWAIADPRRNFITRSHGFQIIKDHEVVYDFVG